MTKLTTLIAALVAAGALVPTAQAAEPIKSIPEDSLDWQTTPEGVAFAELEGNRFTEPYMAMVRLPAGLISPAHTKSANMFGVMISGSMVHSQIGSDPKDDVILGSGSFYKIPKDIPHISKCVSVTECVTFLYQDGKFDFVPVTK